MPCSHVDVYRHFGERAPSILRVLTDDGESQISRLKYFPSIVDVDGRFRRPAAHDFVSSGKRERVGAKLELFISYFVILCRFISC
jgi:hypothetical protein